MTFIGYDQHLDVIATAAARLATSAAAAGLFAPVPTCPGWTVAHLMAHQGMVHRWAAAILRGEDAPTLSETEPLATIPPADLPGWFDEGAAELLVTLRDAPPDLQVPVFLNDAPAPREFWARRQAHETTIHAVDALAAVLGRLPTTSEAAIEPDVALDGIDELLRGFVTRGRAPLPAPEPWTIGVRPDDADCAWLLRVAPGEPIVTERVGPDNLPAPAPGGPDTRLDGSAAQLCLGLWNRGDELRVSGRVEGLADWRESQRIRW